MSLLRLDPRVQVAQHGVVLQQVRERVRAGQIVDRDEIDVLVAERRPHDVPADPAESVDADPHRHRCPPVVKRFWRGQTVILCTYLQGLKPCGYTSCRSPLYQALPRMYLAYSLLTLASSLSCRRTSCIRRSATRNTSAACGSGSAILPISFNVDGEESIWIHAVSVGEALTARALAADLKARYPRLRLFLSTTTIAGQQVARQQPPARRRACSTSRSTGRSSSRRTLDIW